MLELSKFQITHTPRYTQLLYQTCSHKHIVCMCVVYINIYKIINLTHCVNNHYHCLHNYHQQLRIITDVNVRKVFQIDRQANIRTYVSTACICNYKILFVVFVGYHFCSWFAFGIRHSLFSNIFSLFSLRICY